MKTKIFNFELEPKGQREWVVKDGKKVLELTKPDGKYEVFLPHSCDEWDITYGKPEECIKELTNFINEAQEILNELKNL